MYWNENIWKAENSFSSSIKTNLMAELRSFSWFAEEPTKTFTSLICFWSFSDDETLALLIRFWWLAEERPCWLVDLENSQTNKMLTFLVFLMICRRRNTKLGIDLVGLPVWLSRMAGSYFCKHSIPKELFAIIHIIQLKTRAIFEQRKAQEVLGEKQLSLHSLYPNTGLHNLWQPGSRAARKWRENEKMKRKWRENEEIHFVIFSLVPPFLSISYIKNCPILSQNV